MLASELITRVRAVLDDPTDTEVSAAQTFKDPDILANAQEQLRQLIRVQVSAGKGFHNFTMVVKGESTDSIKVHQLTTGCFQYTLPSWVVQVAGVYELASAPTSSFSPYTYAETDLPRQGNEIRRSERTNMAGFRWDGHRVLRMYGFTQAPNLQLDVAKLPAPLLSMKVDNAHAEPKRLYLPQALTRGVEEVVEGCYINAELRVLSSTVADQFGSERRVVYSKAANYDSGTRRHELWVEDAFGSASAVPLNATLESVVPIKDEHSRLLVLLTADACLSQRANLPAMKAIAPELARQMQAFRDFASDADTIKGPYRYLDPNPGFSVGTSKDRMPWN